jgi:hypothetical protein
MNSGNHVPQNLPKKEEKAILIPTSYLPPISYLSYCLPTQYVNIEVQETYPKQTIRNRSYIYGPNGLHILSIPVTKPFGNHTKTKEVRINNNLSWQKQHWRSIETAYNKSPFLLYYQDYFYPFYEQPVDFLVDFNEGIREKIFEILHIDKSISFTSSFVKDPGNTRDLRKSFSGKSAQPLIPEYHQVFADRHGFLSNLSILDLICNLGPDALPYLNALKIS